MSEALQQAYASNASTPLLTLEFTHSAITGGVLRLVQSKYDLVATTESGEAVTFSAAPAMNLTLPDNSTDGSQDLQIQIDNASNRIWTELAKIVAANRVTAEKVLCKYRPYLESDLSAPSGGVYSLTVTGSAINRATATISATYTPIPESAYPRLRYYATKYPGVKYA